MSWFHKLSAGNGTNPPRLPSWPGCITLHAGGGGGGGGLPPCDVTCKLTAPEVLLPGFGSTTVISYDPAVASVPEAASCVAETNAVVSAAPASSTWAPLTKLLPVTVMEKPPAVTRHRRDSRENGRRIPQRDGALARCGGIGRADGLHGDRVRVGRRDGCCVHARGADDSGGERASADAVDLPGDRSI